MQAPALEGFSAIQLTQSHLEMLTPLSAIPQGYGYISGTVLNKTGISDVFVTMNTSNSTISDASGFYSLLVPAGVDNLTVTMELAFNPNGSVIVTAISGTTVMQDIELLKKPTGTISGIAITG